MSKLKVGDQVVWTDASGVETGGTVAFIDPAEVQVRLSWCSIWANPADVRQATTRDGLCFQRPQPR